MSNPEIIRLPERIKKQDDLLNRAVSNNDHGTALVTALHLVKFCNRAAIDTIFPPHSALMSAPWEVAAQVSVSLFYSRNNNEIQQSTGLTLFPVYLGSKSLHRAAQLLSLAQQYLTDVVSRILSLTASSPVGNNSSSPSSLLPPPGSDCQRLATAWPFIVTLSHQGIIAFYGGRQRLALGYVEAAISMVKNTLGIYNCSTVERPSSSVVKNTNNSKNKNSNNNNAVSPARASSPQSQRRGTSLPLIVIPSNNNNNNKNETNKNEDENDVGKMTSRTTFINSSNLSSLRSAAVKLTRLMNGRKECAIQLIVLLLNYSRILVSLRKYSHARDSAAVAKLMLEDLQDVEFAKAAEMMAEVAMNESQDWPSILNGRTNLPLLQSFCGYTLADVDVLCRPTNVNVLEQSLLMFRDADLAAAAADLGGGNGYRRMILEKAKMVAEQLDLVQQTLVKELLVTHEETATGHLGKSNRTGANNNNNNNFMNDSCATSSSYYLPESIQNSAILMSDCSIQQNSPLPRNPTVGSRKSAPSTALTSSSSASQQKSHINDSASSAANMLKSSLIQRMRRESPTTKTLSDNSSHNGRVHHHKTWNATPVRVGYRAFEASQKQFEQRGRCSSASILMRNTNANNSNNNNVRKKVHFIGSRSPSPF